MVRHAALSCAVVFTLACTAGAQLKEWPQWRGPNRDGIGDEKGLLSDWTTTKPRLVWNSRDIAGGKKSIGAGYSSISIVAGRIFVIGDHGKDSYLYALEQRTGKQIWERKMGPSHTGSTGGPRCTPTIDGERVYALTNQGLLACLSVKDGTVLWSKDFVKDFSGKSMASWHFCESPLVDGEKLVCTPGAEDAGLVALDKLTGKEIWRSAIPKSGGCGYSSIVVADVGGIRQYITFMNSAKGLVGVDAVSGKLLWSYRKVANGTGNIPTPIVTGDLVFASTGYNTGAVLLQLVPDKGGITAVEKYFLKHDKLQNHHGQMILVGGHVYGGHGHNSGHPFCLDLASGKMAWGPETSPGKKSAAVAYADGHIYLRYEDNVLALIEATPTTYKLKGTFDIPGKGLDTGWAQPVILDGMLYIRGRDQLLCFDIRARG